MAIVVIQMSADRLTFVTGEPEAARTFDGQKEDEDHASNVSSAIPPNVDLRRRVQSGRIHADRVRPIKTRQ